MCYVYVYESCVLDDSVTRIHILVDETAKARYQGQAKREGKSLGAWMREAAQEKLEAMASSRRIDSPDELRRFFQACDVRERGSEPDWDEHRRVIDRSRTAGLDAT